MAAAPTTAERIRAGGLQCWRVERSAVMRGGRAAGGRPVSAGAGQLPPAPCRRGHRVAHQGVETAAGPRQALGDFVAAETARWKDVIQANHIRAE